MKSFNILLQQYSKKFRHFETCSVTACFEYSQLLCIKLKTHSMFGAKTPKLLFRSSSSSTTKQQATDGTVNFN